MAYKHHRSLDVANKRTRMHVVAVEKDGVVTIKPAPPRKRKVKRMTSSDVGLVILRKH